MVNGFCQSTIVVDGFSMFFLHVNHWCQWFFNGFSDFNHWYQWFFQWFFPIQPLPLNEWLVKWASESPKMQTLNFEENQKYVFLSNAIKHFTINCQEKRKTTSQGLSVHFGLLCIKAKAVSGTKRSRLLLREMSPQVTRCREDATSVRCVGSC